MLQYKTIPDRLILINSAGIGSRGFSIHSFLLYLSKNRKIQNFRNLTICRSESDFHSICPSGSPDRPDIRLIPELPAQYDPAIQGWNGHLLHVLPQETPRTRQLPVPAHGPPEADFPLQPTHPESKSPLHRP